jgi:uncharacterized protein YlzI (FlbEa/FlbD family)
MIVYEAQVLCPESFVTLINGSKYVTHAIFYVLAGYA